VIVVEVGCILVGSLVDILADSHYFAVGVDRNLDYSLLFFIIIHAI
jgi:hypothetical protein